MASVELTRRPHRDVERTAPNHPVSVALVAMPFAAIERPSIQIGLLGAIADRAGHDATPLHLNVEFARELRTHHGEVAVEQYGQLAGKRYASADWFFAGEAFGADAPDPELALTGIEIESREPPAGEDETSPSRPANSVELTALLRKIRDHIVPQYLDRMMAEVDWAQFDVVGFTSTFQQSAAAIALARRIKRVHPEAIMLFGGSNFDGDMGREWVRGVDVIDYVIQGEADTSFVSFLDAIGDGGDPVGIPGVLARRNGRVAGREPEVVADISANPAPDYRDFFERMDGSGLVDHLDLAIPFESARGCWWGAKRHCTFCGLNGQTMEFRSKRPQRVIDEVVELALAHRVLRFEAVDNILDMSYFDAMLPSLARQGRPFSLFYEVKADLTREQLELMVAAGVDIIQPGIESVHSRVLGLMRKGTRAIWNVNVLRWCRYYGISVAWNVLWGFPGERVEHVGEQAASLPLIHHLEPTGSGGRIWLERFSPLFTDRERFPARRVSPQTDYAHVYPASLDHERIAYFFDYELEDTLPDADYAPLQEAIAEWHRLVAAETEMYLLVRDDGDTLRIRDRRDDGPEVTRTLHGLDAEVHRRIMDTWSTPAGLADALDVPEDAIAASLERLVAARLVFVDGNLHLALALPEEAPAIRGRVCELPNPWKRAPA